VPLDPYRLPESVRPSHYELALDLDLEAEAFEGSVAIDVHVIEPTNLIVLNADQLEIESATVTTSDEDGTMPTTCAVELDEPNERIMLHVDDALDLGPAMITLTFSGRFSDKLVGPYLSRFTDADGVERTLATTQFEATHARKCFPCWDEPAFKSTFRLTLTIDAGLDAVANSVEESRTTNADDRTVITFGSTMAMSTYLVAFAAGPLEITDPIDVDGVPLRIVHVPGKSELTSFALEAGAFALRYFAEYFDLPYPGDKIDLVAIPDFAFGAMENLGCITFREVLLLIDPAKATQAELQRSADVINHELAHMWFGDLVTMKWWNGLWLNEAFATFMEMRCTDAFRPAWQRWVDFSLSRSEALDTDTLASTRPIEFEVVSPTDAEGMFDILTYEKGAAVVRMLEQYLGEDRFREGIRRYMRENQYANAETTDLWDAIEAETGEPVRRIMDSWIFQGGYPLIAARPTADVGDASGFSSTLAIEQERMRYAGIDESSDRRWAAPILISWKASGDDEARRERLLLDDEVTELKLDADPEWLVLNAGGASFLRVAYTDDQLDTLAEVSSEQLEAVERYAVLDDAYASLLAGRTSSMAFLNLIEAMSGESDRSVWQRLIAGLRQLDRLVDGEARERLQDIAHDVLAPPLANLGLAPRADDDDRSRQLRGDLVRALGTVANDPEIQEEAKRAVATGLRDPELVDAALLAASVDVVAAVGDETDFNDFVEAWKLATTPQAEIRYLNALCDFPEASLVARLHALILDGQVRTQNAPFLLGRSLANRHSGQQTWDFIVGNWDRLISMFATSSIVRMLAGLPRLDLPEQADAAAAFFDEHPVPSGARTLTQLLEKQRVHVAVRQRERDRLQAFLTA